MKQGNNKNRIHKDDNKDTIVLSEDSSTYSNELKVINEKATVKDTVDRINRAVIYEDSIRKAVFEPFVTYRNIQDMNLLKLAIDNYLKTDGALSEQISYDITEFCVTNGNLCDYIQAFKSMNNANYLNEFVKLLNYSIDYFDDYCKNRNKNSCYAKDRAIFEQICGY